jgi:AcrR family transcriptional regulator
MHEKSKITNYAEKTFLENGFYKITMDEIARGLSISKKTIYKYFPSKNRLVDEVISLFQLRTKSKIEQAIANESNSIAKIKALANIFAELSIKLNQKLLFDVQTHRPDLWEKIENFREKLIRRIWEDIINQGKKEKYIIDKPNDIIITIIYSAIRSVINPAFLLNHNYSTKEAFKITFDIIIMGILTPKGLQVYNKIEQENKNEKD